jgi:CRP-like cAMP-binding protein
MERPTSTERAAFAGYVRRVMPLDDSDFAPVEAEVRVRPLLAREAFLRGGDHAVDCGTVLSGLVREYFPLEDGREVTRAFAGPGDNVGSLSDLLSVKPALTSAVAEADTRVAVVPWRLIRELATQRPAWAAYVARITERLYLAKAAREYELLALDAEARYHRFRALYSALEPMIALRHAASYVGITPEHLSRLRRKLRHRPIRASRLSGPPPK